MAIRERKTTVTKKGGAGGKIVCLLLGFILGVTGTIGGVGGLGYYAVTQVKIKDAVGTVNDLAGLEIDYTEYVDESYGDSSLLGLIEDIVGAVGELQGDTGSLNTLQAISPMVGTGVQKLIDTVAGYGVTIDYDGLMSTPFKQLGDFITETVNGTEIAPLVESVTGNAVEGMLAMICYGEPGEDYIVLEDGTVQMLGGATSATIGSLTNSEQLQERLSGLSFYTLMDSLGGVNDEDPIIRTLVYGEEGVDYVITDEGITPLPKAYVLNVSTSAEDPTAMTFTDPDGVVFSPVADGVWQDESGNVIQLREDYETYQFDVLDSEQNLIYNLKTLDTEGDLVRFQAYVDGVAQTRKGPYLSDVIGEDADLLGVVGAVRLGDILKLNGQSDAIMLAVAYGQKDVDYTVDENDVIHPITPPITINDLIGGDGMEIVKDIPLSTVLEIESPLQEGVDSLMMIIAFGERDIHYQLVDSNKDGVYDDWKWLNDENGEPYSERTIGYLMGDAGKTIFDDLTIETLMNVNANSDNLMRALAYGNEETHYIRVDGNPNDGVDSLDTIQMLPMRYFVTGTEIYDEEHILIGSLGNEVATGIYEVTVNGVGEEYIKANAEGGYDVFATLEDAQNHSDANDLRMRHTKTKLVDLRGSTASTRIERIELAAALDVHIFGTGSDAPDPLMVQLAFGVEGKHYVLDRENEKIIWLKDEDPTSDTYGLHYHARTIHDMKDTHALIESIYLDTALELNASSPAIMLALAYGNDYTIEGNKVISNERRTIADLMGSNAKSLIEGIHLDTVLGLDKDSPAILLALAYGNDYTIVNGEVQHTTVHTLGDLMGSNSASLIEGIAMNKIITADADDPMMNYILYGTTAGADDANATPRTLGDFMNNSSTIIEGMMNDLTLKEALGEEATGGQMLKHLQDVKLCDLNTEIEKLTLQQALGDDIADHPILKHIAGSTISTIDEDLSNLSIQQVMDTETNGIYHYETIDGASVYAVQVEENGQSVWKAVTYTDANGIRTWTFADGSAAPSPLTGAWKYLLIDKTTGEEKLYALEDMNAAIGNVSANIEKATLNDLAKDGIVNLSEDLLTREMITTVSGMEIDVPENKDTLGELTVKEAITYLSTVLDVLSKFAS